MHSIGSKDIISSVKALMELREELGEEEFKRIGSRVHSAAFQVFSRLVQRIKSR